MIRRVTSLALPFLIACGDATTLQPPIGQVVLYVTTDAPLPPAPGELFEPTEPPPLFDRLRVEVFAPGAKQPCADCSREFELHRVLVREGKASMGIVPEPGVTGYVARARLFRAINLKGGEPPPLSTIEVYAQLPEVESEGLVRATVVLRVEDVGDPVGSLDRPIVPQRGMPDFSKIGLWPKAERVPCEGAARPGEVCVPGGAFWMGHPYSGTNEDGSDASASRLVVVRPFFADLREVTVGEFRASGLEVMDGDYSVDPLIGPFPPDAEYMLDLEPENDQFFCTYSQEPFSDRYSRDDRPVNCVSWTRANEYCKAQGKTLPTEAQFEYMASGLRSSLFVWGHDPPECGDAVWGRWGVGPYAGSIANCRGPDDPGGPLPAGRGRLDRLSLEEGEIVDLVGNLSEWVRDHWNRSDELCWGERALLEDPECRTNSALDGDLRTVKGFAWHNALLPVAHRVGRDPSIISPGVGFRCVRPDGE